MLLFKKAAKMSKFLHDAKESEFLHDIKELILTDYGWVVLIFALVITIVFGKLTNFVAIYTALGLNSQIFQFSGVLLGLILAAYAIFITLLPITDKTVVETCAFRRINAAFIFELIAVTVMTIASLLLLFLNDQLILPAIIYFQFWLLLVIIAWIFLLVRIFYDIFNNIRSYKMKKTNPA